MMKPRKGLAGLKIIFKNRKKIINCKMDAKPINGTGKKNPKYIINLDPNFDSNFSIVIIIENKSVTIRSFC